jgi:hypothetical protein
MIFDTIQDPLSQEELKEVKANARERLALWRRRALSSGVCLFLACAAVVPFALAGSSLSSERVLLAKLLTLLAMALLPVFLYCAALFWGAWQALRDIEKDDMNRPL